MSMLSRFATLGGKVHTDPYWTDVSFLLEGNGANGTTTNIIDLSNNNTPITISNAVISTAQSKYGSGSVYFNGTNARLTFPTANTLNFGANNFTIEMWCYVNLSSYPVYINLLDTRVADSFDGFLIGIYGSNLDVVYGTSQRMTSSASVPLNNWNYLAFVRSGSTLTMYLNSVNIGSTSMSGEISIQNTACSIGEGSTLNWPLNGYIYDLRITKNIARTITANPTGPFPT
jgi:hypothetical protein